ncbi:MAG: ABC transporter ATP-binding protein [Mycoplasmataceae bacterium CE_OT135]|nr:MAG: ABC transporter ATP-binding protein [Mycoplasmataceae bacterium CE_OT135]
MPRAAIFTSEIFQQKKPSKTKLLWTVFKNIVKKNPGLFFFNTFLAITVAIVNFNVGINLVEFFSQRSWKETIFQQRYNFFFYPFGKLAGGLSFWKFFGRVGLLVLVGKGILNLLHYYWMNYAYDKVEDDLRKDLFHHFVQADYSRSSQIAPQLTTQFTLSQDIARELWFIANRIIYVSVAIFFLFRFGLIGRDFKDQHDQKISLDVSKFIWITLILFFAIFVVEFLLFKKATRLNTAKKKRHEEENRHIFERINNLEYIKTTSGEEYEQQKLNKLVDKTFKKNKKALFWGVLFEAVPTQVLVPNIGLFFILLSAFLTVSLVDVAENPAFSAYNFLLITNVVLSLRSEIEKIVQACANLDDLSSDLMLLNESIHFLHQEKKILLTEKLLPFTNGDINFEKVNFAYPRRPDNLVLRDFSFRFKQGKKYGIAGRNGIGKSTITKTTLKLYNIQEGKISIAERNIQEIATKSLHERICYLTNRPGFFKISLAENVFYPHPPVRDKSTKEEHLSQEDLTQLTHAAKKVGIWEFIETLPQGFRTELKERGGDLSEGQKQQIATMRIFIRDYDIYIFDEILSNVQKDLKAKILANVFTHLKDKTIIVIDHHYDIFQYVDEVHQFTGERLIKLKKEELLGEAKN